MKKFKMGAMSALLALCMAMTLGLGGCGVGDQVAQLISGNVTGEVAKEYQTKWFTFTVESMSIGDTYEGYTAGAGNTLLIAHITETNTSGQSQPFGTFDWYVTPDSTTPEDFIYPLDPLNDNMMPLEVYLQDGETLSCDVVIEYPADLSNPHLMYIEVDEHGDTYTTFKIPVK